MTDRFRFFSLTLPGDISAVSKASQWLRELGTRHGLAAERLHDLDFCASELVANVVHHSYRHMSGEIVLEILLDQGTAVLRLIDNGEAFDPLAVPAPPLPTSLESIKVGGFGLQLVRSFADTAHYERTEKENRVAVWIGAQRMQPQESDRSNISRTTLFCGVPQCDVDKILTHCELRTFNKKEILLGAGQQHRCVLVAVEGTLQVHLDHPGSPFYVELGPGECVGELSVTDGKPNSAWVVAGSPGRVLVIPEAIFLGEMLGVRAIVRNLIVVLSERMRRSNIEIVERVRAVLELESLQRELDVARQIQSSMLPRAPLFPPETPIEGHGYMRAARHVGGDFYDAFALAGGRVFVAIGDVCSKGTPAALFMVRTLTVLRNEALQPESDPVRHLSGLASRCNEILNEANAAQQFVTFFCAIIDPMEQRLYFVNAGHNPPLLHRAGSEPSFVAEPSNPLVGLVPELSYSVGDIEFPPGSLILLYTDGVTEAESRTAGFYGEDALQRLFSEITSTDPEHCVERVVAAVDAFTAGDPQADDITLLAVRHNL